MVKSYPRKTVYWVYKNASKNEYRTITLFNLSRINYYFKRWYNNSHKYKFTRDITKCKDYAKYKKIWKLLYRF